jgi:hypothetical protein
VAKLTEELAGSAKEAAALKEEAQKAEILMKEVQLQLPSKGQAFDTANDTITGMKARLGTLERMIESAVVHEKQLIRDLENTRVLQKDAEDKLANQVQQRDLWIKSLVDIAERLTAQIAMMGMESIAVSVDMHEVPSVKLALFFDGLIEGLRMHEEERAAHFANESRKLARNALFMVLSNIAFRHPDINLADGFRRLPEGADISAVEEKAAPFANNMLSVPRAS